MSQDLHAPVDGPLATRRAGVLLHVTSLPGGRLGAEAFGFVDFLAAAGCTVWQVLPLVPPHEDDGSPYNSLSVMAGSPDLIDTSRPSNPEARDSASYADWCARQADWLEPYVEFMAIRQLLDRAPWPTWEPGLRDRERTRVDEVLAGAGTLVDDLRLEQWTFAEQWGELRDYAAARGILMFGDLPIFVSHDSADVWATRDLFLLDAEGRPVTVTGVPPDYFAANGQKWNNPHYDWEAMAADDYAWWRRRIARQRELFDLVRIDHFRGFAAAWHVPVDAPTAKNGWWVDGAGHAVVGALVETAGPGTLVAEDLGVITPEVEALRLDFGLPGMKVLQFAFDGSKNNPYLPEHHEAASVVYTGTHDNDTTAGWWGSLGETGRASVRRELADPHEPMPWALVRLVASSVARLAVVPAQDLLGLGSESRMNTPGTDEGNWSWRAASGSFTDVLATRMHQMFADSSRAPSGETLYAAIGGIEAIHRLEDAFYSSVLTDPVLRPLFGSGRPEHVPHLTAFTAESFGGPDDFSRELGFAYLIEVHRGLGITEDQRRRFVELYVAAMDQVGLPDDPWIRGAVVSHVEFGSRVAMQNSHATTDEELHPLREVPRWTLEPEPGQDS